LSFLKKINMAEANISESKNEDRYLIYRRHAGIGDLLIGLYYSWKYACATKRKLIVDWRWSTYVYNSSNLFSYLFKDCFIAETSISGTDIDKIKYPSPFYPSFYNNINIHNPPDIDSNKIYKNYLGKEKDTLKICSLFPFKENTVIMNESVRVFPYKEDIGDKGKNFINIIWNTLSEHIVSHMEKTHLELFSDKKNIVGIHIRLGNNDNSFNKTFRKRVKGYYGQNIKDYIQQEIMPIVERTPKDHHIYITTDTEEATCQAQKLIPNCIVYEKWFPPPGHEIHFSSSKGVESNGLEIIRDSLTEIFLLSHCDNVYSTFNQSAFVKIAGLLNKCPTIHFL